MQLLNLKINDCMATQIPQPIIQVYKEVNIGKYKSVKHYELLETNFKPILSELLNISKDRNCALSTPEYWLKHRLNNKWSTCLTGLFKTPKNNVFKGDLQKRKHLVLFKYSQTDNTLTVFTFENYYTRDLSNVWHFLNNCHK